MTISILISIYTVHFAFLKVYTNILKHWFQLELRNLRQKFPLDKKKNEQIKGLISIMWLFFLHNSSLSSFVPNFRILTQVVAEKSLTEKKFTDRKTDRQTDRQTNIITDKAEKAKTIYPLYTSYRGYNKLKMTANIIPT